jgi:hypothetical protein
MSIAYTENIDQCDEVIAVATNPGPNTPSAKGVTTPISLPGSWSDASAQKAHKSASYSLALVKAHMRQLSAVCPDSPATLVLAGAQAAANASSLLDNLADQIRHSWPALSSGQVRWSSPRATRVCMFIAALASWQMTQLRSG